MLWCKVLFLLTLDGCGGIDIYGNRKGGRRPEHSVLYSEETFDHREFLKLGIIVPHTQWLERKRRYLQIISSSLSNLDRNVLLAINESYRFEFSRRQELRAPDDSINFDEVVAVSPPPRDILDLLCDQIRNSSAAIIYLTDTERYGRSTASSQYFLQLAAYLGIPVIAWNPDNSGLEKRTFQDGQKSIGKLQLAPTIEHQVSAMLSILVRYNWHQFGIVTSEIAGHDDFVQTIREKIPGYQDTFRFIIQDVFKLTESKNYTVEDLAKSEVRIFLLYSTQREAELIMQKGAAAGLTGSNYLWIVTQSVVGDPKDKVSLREKFPIGMLGIHFIVDLDTVLHHIVPLAVQIFSYGAMSLVRSNRGRLNYDLSCEGNITNWDLGNEFYRHLLNVTVPSYDKEPVFKPDGTTRHVTLKIVNLRPTIEHKMKWEEVGSWGTRTGLDIKDIVWPDNSHVPPQGVPEKFSMKITFLEEPPFIIVSEPDPVSGRCSMNRGVSCLTRSVENEKFENETLTRMCCSGLLIDLLRKFEDDLGFNYDLIRVDDPKWGTQENGKWNGLMGVLVNKKTDMVLSSLKISREREKDVDFTVPFLESGIAIVVAKRTGIISPTAFLEPFDINSWMLVVLVAVQAAALSIFIFEWLSPAGYDMKVLPTKTGHRFSLFRTYWLVCAVLFQASVQVDCPRGLTSRFMSSIWALFAVVFLAIYTANLAAFMIPRKEYHDLTGLTDSRISNPQSHKPPLKFTTLPYSHAYVTLQKYHAEVYDHIKSNKLMFNTSEHAVQAVKEGLLDAFIYDGTVLSYLVSQDEECRLLQVGSWSAMTGYGLAFPTNSKYRTMFNDKLLDYRENGDLERLGRFWLHGTCKPNEQEKRASEPLSEAQFLSAFLLLVCGIITSIFLLTCEHIYLRYFSPTLREKTIYNSWVSIFNKDAASQSRNQLVRSCSIPEAIAGEWENKQREGSLASTKLCSTRRTSVRSFLDLGYGDQNCSEDVCKTKLRRLRGDLDCAKDQIRMLEDQLNKHGIPLRRTSKEIAEKETVL